VKIGKPTKGKSRVIMPIFSIQEDCKLCINFKESMLILIGKVVAKNKATKSSGFCPFCTESDLFIEANS